MSESDKLEVGFEDIAVSVKLERRERSYAFGEPRVMSVAPGNVAPNVTGSAITGRLAAISLPGFDKKAVRDIIEQFEGLAPSGVMASLGVLTTNPYTAISAGQVTSVDQSVLQQWMTSPLFQAASTTFSGPVELLDFNIELVDEKTAATTYTVHQSGLSAPTAAILIKDSNGIWRVSVHCQHPVSG